MNGLRGVFALGAVLLAVDGLWAQQGVSVGAAAPVVHVAFPDGAGTVLGAKVAALLRDPVAARDHWGIAVTALDGTPLYGYDEGELFRPASNNKLFTTAAAMELLGPENTVKTSVMFAKPVSDGVSKGDVTLYGEGDAGLSGQDFPYQTIAERRAAGLAAPTVSLSDALRGIEAFAAGVAKAGVTRVDGDVVGMDVYWTWEPYPIAWDIGDMLTGDGAPVSALTVNDNLLDVMVTPGATVGAKVSFSAVPEIGYYTYDVEVTTVSAGARTSLQIERAPGSKVVRVYGTIAIGAPYKDEIAIMDPAEFAAMALKMKLGEHGVTVTGVARAEHRWPVDGDGFVRESHEALKLPTEASGLGIAGDCEGGCAPRVTLEHVSPTVAEDVKETLKISQNLHAELMLRRLGRRYGDNEKNTAAQGARVVRQFLVNAGIDGDDFLLYDGSGMSGHDLVTPRATARLLSYAMEQPWFAAWKAALPVGGVDGSLTARFPAAPLKGHVFAKTGTLGESRALSGYLDCVSGRQVVFSVMVDDHLPGSAADRVTMDKIVEAIAGSL